MSWRFFLVWGLTVLCSFIWVTDEPKPPALPKPNPSERTKDGIVLRDVATDVTDANHEDDGEASIAINPKNPNEIAIVTFCEQWNRRDESVAAPIWRSLDGGTSWQKELWLSQPKRFHVGPSDQSIAFTKNGILMAVTMATPVGKRRVGFFQWQEKNGTSLSKASPPFAKSVGLFDQPGLLLHEGKQLSAISSWLDIETDPKTQNEKKGIVKITRFDPTTAAIKEDQIVTTKHRTIRTARGADGKLYLFYKSRIEKHKPDADFEYCEFRVHRSDDAGVTWNAIKAGNGSSSPSGVEKAVSFFTEDFGVKTKPVTLKRLTSRCASSDGWIATHPKKPEKVYAVYVDRDKTIGKARLILASSTDFAATWKTLPVTDGTHHVAFPELAVCDDGTVGILYVDYEDTGTSTIFSHWFARRTEGKDTWDHFLLQKLDPSTLTFYPEPTVESGKGAVVLQDGFHIFWGDYEALTAFGSTFYGAFTGASIGRKPTQLDPIFFVVPPSVKKGGG